MWDTVITICFCTIILAFVFSVILGNTKYKPRDDFKPWPQITPTGVSYPDGVQRTGVSYPDGVGRTGVSLGGPYINEIVVSDVDLSDEQINVLKRRWNSPGNNNQIVIDHKPPLAPEGCCPICDERRKKLPHSKKHLKIEKK